MPDNYFINDKYDDVLVRLPFVKSFSGKGKTQIYHDMAHDTFPKNVAIGLRSRAWLLSELIRWRDSKIVERDESAEKDK